MTIFQAAKETTYRDVIFFPQSPQRFLKCCDPCGRIFFPQSPQSGKKTAEITEGFKTL